MYNNAADHGRDGPRALAEKSTSVSHEVFRSADRNFIAGRSDFGALEGTYIE